MIKNSHIKKDSFTLIPNYIFDHGLSFEALGVLGYLATQFQNNEKFKIDVDSLLKVNNSLNRGDLTSVLQQLQNKGFVDIEANILNLEF
ncbi:hypothetical protein WAX88_01275 [Photobacterium damselae subsp. damselae]|uniref:hypothetical protein n=1 Tax=Photobacterium damselae TaxID=38293 RepID=UPI00311ABBC8